MKNQQLNYEFELLYINYEFELLYIKKAVFAKVAKTGLFYGIIILFKLFLPRVWQHDS